jgi:hypothetical protein
VIDVDSTILVQFLVQDDPKQAEAVRLLFGRRSQRPWRRPRAARDCPRPASAPVMMDV